MNYSSILFLLLGLFAFTVNSNPLLGAKECTWGPSYWCGNLTNAKNCHAVKHCIQTVWTTHKYVEDNDSVCKICKDMVQQARDQLESNETQEELKEVFEGSCKLIPLKTIAKSCIKFVDEYIPELTDVLASQMDPNVVCSVAGLCNNAEIDRLLLEQETGKPQKKVIVEPIVKSDDDVEKKKTILKEMSTSLVKKLDCDGCGVVMDRVKANFDGLKPSELLQAMIKVCGTIAGSFTEGCTEIIINNFKTIQMMLGHVLTTEAVCPLSGVCSEYPHPEKNSKSNVVVIPNSAIGVEVKSAKDSLPCDLCSQLVLHLRDTLIANTTKEEFKTMLDSMCNRLPPKEFTKECLSLVDEYYSAIYDAMVNELDPNMVCQSIGLCPGQNLLQNDYPIWPLISEDLEEKVKEIMIMDEQKPQQSIVSITERSLSTQEIQQAQLPVSRILTLPSESDSMLSSSEIQAAQLPIDRIMPHSILLGGAQSSNELCSLCEFVLHEIQVDLQSFKEEEKIKQAVKNVCSKLPNVLTEQCDQFVDSYGDAIITILSQQIDPTQVCPLLSMCPKENINQQVEILKSDNEEVTGKNCPLCLFAVKELEDVVKDKKNEETIKKALDNLCSHLPQELKDQCDQFVDSYSNELIEMIIADLNPQEICVYLKLCKDKMPAPTLFDDIDLNTSQTNHLDRIFFEGTLIPNQPLKNNEILTNEINDNTVGGKQIATDHSTIPGFCPLCKKVVNYVEDEIANMTNINEDDVVELLKKSCYAIPLPDNEINKCIHFIETYGGKTISLIIEGFSAEYVCSFADLCADTKFSITEDASLCDVCEASVNSLTDLVNRPNVDQDLYHVLRKSCFSISQNYVDQCHEIMDTHGKYMMQLIKRNNLDAYNICKKMSFCGGSPANRRRPLISKSIELVYEYLNKCERGPTYWCQDLETAKNCGEKAFIYCQTKVWNSNLDV